MSMGYDDDDPRREAFKEKLALGIWKLAPGQKPNVDASKRRAGAMPSRYGLKGMKST
jgi:hypothetical protein